jgi:hypothetical protein
VPVQDINGVLALPRQFFSAALMLVKMMLLGRRELVIFVQHRHLERHIFCLLTVLLEQF